MSLGTPKFTRINESFTCQNCGHTVPPSSSTCRDHCPRCLYSLHVDINPGDRAAQCGAPLVPKAYSQHKKKGFLIHYVCSRCGKEKVNRFLDWDEQEADGMEALLALSSVSGVR
jgi:DNA-directed RNA polymerase subunit RPC12/RpoP